MKALGIIAEYNPFHWGHAYQLAKARQLAGDCPIIVLMSGNVVQRGEFAVLDKWTRARLALSYGADVVIEAPITATLQGADYFASKHIQLLAKLGIDAFLFGTEQAQVSDLEALLDFQERHADALDDGIQKYLQKGHSYAASVELAMQAIYDAPANFQRDAPNHLLSLQYLRANRQLAKPLTPLSLQRVQAFQGHKVLSGSQIRQALSAGKLLEDSVPPETYQVLLDAALPQMEAYYPMLRYRVLTLSKTDLANMYGIREGIEARFMAACQEHTSFEAFTQYMISKRWTRASIQRLSMHVLLNHQLDTWQQADIDTKAKPALRILGMSQRGQAWLKHVDTEQVDLFSNLKQKHFPRYELNYQADQVMQLGDWQSVPEQNRSRFPMIIR
ncbi:nucleotidyltransferase family protein [Suicoccus acidiformans]|uniref:tRNA(Met) cytidine acetate ligase n=1 Tax=Suicoccus acidiformans TaxID=2036206 RepID=UPI0013C31264|nr:nucleotidyltransferase family protein [Suicoccus acidiformans]